MISLIWGLIVLLGGLAVLVVAIVVFAAELVVLLLTFLVGVLRLGIHATYRQIEPKVAVEDGGAW